MMIKKTLTLFALAGLAHIGMAQAAIPADVSAAPGLLFVNWHDNASSSSANPTLMIRNASGDLLKQVPAELKGMQQVRLPMRAQGNLTLSLDGDSDSYRMPYSVGSGRQR
ncbi:TPA: hypothetical protein ACNUUK_003128 [Aeromonas salmonicida subsp. smithia]|nr:MULTISPECIES: hypothetical protein [Aeromonas]MBP6140978.1 hypothetical protein [Aeromonas sp.]KTA81692.1 hypothetical protein VO70_16350 [Aeromonas salmonicida]MBP6450680.1 hypothetical protein [Aeromonas sp.]MCE9934398.1 hypothetical protein [Aeromonas salmonicida]UUI60758.1 hypothetical protein NP805_22085 [Aeromonas salmonicida]